MTIALLLALAGFPPNMPTPHQLTVTERHDYIEHVIGEQKKILQSLPLPDPDSANEPDRVIFSTGMSINVTYWAPNFVLSLEAFPNEPATAVLTRFQFPKDSRVEDPRTLPTQSSWTDVSKCPGLQPLFESVNVAANHAAHAITNPVRPKTTEYDGGGYTLSIRDEFGQQGSLTLSGNDDSIVGQWTSSAMSNLKRCWEPFA